MTSIQFKASTDIASEPVDQAVLKGSLFKMTTSDRLKLGKGPSFTLQVGEAIVARSIPKRAAMGMSVFFNEALSKHTRSSTIMLNPAEVSEQHVRVLIDYVVCNAKTKSPFSIRAPATLCELVDLYRHAKSFGMSIPAGDLRSKILDHLRIHTSISYVALECFIKLPASDVCYQAVVRKFEGLVHVGCIDGNQEWDSWLSGHPQFAADMKTWQTERRKLAGERRQRQKKLDWEKDFPPLA